MGRTDGLDFRAAPMAATPQPSPTSYFSTPEEFLDPRLFAGQRMHDDVANDLKARFDAHMSRHYHNHQKWAKLWLAGSGASYQWSASRDPGDLDMLVGVDYPQFRYHNQRFARLTDEEVSKVLNDRMRADLTIDTQRWTPPSDPKNEFEVTWYCNPGSTDIRAIKPYAAYDVVNHRWDVEPNPHPVQPDHRAQADRDRKMTLDILKRYEGSRTMLSQNPANRQKHAETVWAAAQQGHALFHEIHGGRHAAFGPGGAGYADPSNARWQHAKANGLVPALRALADFFEDSNAAQELRMYGVTLPDTDELVLRAVLSADER